MNFRISPRAPQRFFNRTPAPFKLRPKTTERAGGRKTILQYLREGEVPARILNEGTFWNYHTGRLLENTGAPTYEALREGIEFHLGKRHPEGSLGIFRSLVTDGSRPAGVNCAGHAGRAQYYRKASYPPPGEKRRFFFLGLECVADVLTFPAADPISKEVRDLSHALEQKRSEIDKAWSSLRESPKDAERKRTLTEAVEAYQEVKESMRKALIEASHEPIESYNQEHFLKKSPQIREWLASILHRAAFIQNRDELLAVYKVARRIRAVESYARGVSQARLYLDLHAVEFLKRVFKDLTDMFPELKAWPSYDLGMRTFERYLMKESGKHLEGIISAKDLAFVAAELVRWQALKKAPQTVQRRETEEEIAAALQLKDIYEKLLRKGTTFVSRQGYVRERPKHQEDLRLLFECQVFLPDQVAELPGILSVCGVVERHLEAYGTREFLPPRLPTAKEERRAPSAPEPHQGVVEAIADEDAPFLKIRDIFKEGEKVGRFVVQEAEEVDRIITWVKNNCVSREQIKKEYPSFEGAIARYERVGELLTDPAENLSVRRAIVLWRSPDQANVYPRVMAEGLIRLLDERSRMRPLIEEKQGAAASLVTNLHFGPMERSGWRYHMNRFGKEYGLFAVRAFDALRMLCSDRDKKRKRLTLREAQGLQAFYLALTRSTKTRRAPLQTKGFVAMHNEELFARMNLLTHQQKVEHRFGGAVTPDEEAQLRFLWPRGLFPPALAEKVLALPILVGRTEEVKRAKVGLARLAHWGLSLPENESRFLQKVLDRAEETGAIEARYKTTLEILEIVFQADQPTLDVRWFCIFARVAHPPFYVNQFDEILAPCRDCTKAEWQEILGRLRQAAKDQPQIQKATNYPALVREIESRIRKA